MHKNTFNNPDVFCNVSNKIHICIYILDRYSSLSLLTLAHMHTCTFALLSKKHGILT